MRKRAEPWHGRLFSAGRHSAADPLPAFAWWEVSAIVLIAGSLLFVRLDRYDFIADELYFIAAGRRPAVSYADQGPVVPLLAAFADHFAPGSTVAVRLPALLMTLAATVVSALIAREFRGARGPQTLAALAYAVTPAAVTQSAMLSTYALEATLTALISWLFIRWVRTHSDYLLVLAGAVAALDFQVKWLVPMVWAAFALGWAILGPREVFRRPAWWLGSGLLAVSVIPATLWQHANSWPQVAMGAVVREEQAALAGLAALPWEIVLLTGPIGVLLLAGLWAGIRSPRIEPYRFLIPVVIAGLAGIIGGGLRPYYIVSAFPGLFAAGAVYLADVGVPRAVRTAGVVLTATATAICVTAVVALPLPRSDMREPTDKFSQIDWRVRLYGPSGWNELVRGVDDAYRQVPTEQLPGLVLVTQNYWQAAALDHYGPRLGLPAVYSTNRGYGYFAAPPDTTTTILYVGTHHPETALGLDFTETVELVRLDDRLGYPGVNRYVSVWKCRYPDQLWSAAWPGMRRLMVVDGTTH
ncbi:ArnT family glycosyltransferase [Nocardia goodfellowii]|uniref:4-amino-4-deoxy-L-arabinose transferase-like glycosyltransferase n=1 Tax=Nocardia goodfellowii TaxID=882446 RepID=A0ABS4QKP4_9NOCA|nr:glycosyltransferase family 39 protein [Nocardia goodfellowii]MBP2192277.1 4-amino-4-deoxy-L-arabinose transferase-like glycosyltransferase [Nocardia goodfellowii]